jgi:hypothetical protein
MLKRIFSICLLALPFLVFGQNYISTPYSRFIVGDLINSGFSYNRALGGTSIALRPNNQINYLNPASYTSQDTLSFLFEAGAAQRFVTIKSDLDEDRSRNMNIEYLLLGFPINRWWKFSTGVVPYSRTQYYYQDILPVTPDTFNIDYVGKGGLNEFYLGSAFKINEFISVGFNAGYVFGTINRSRKESIISTNPDYTNFSAVTNLSDKITASDFYFKIGLQAYKTFAVKHRLIAGITIDPKTKIKLKLNNLTSRTYYSYYDTLNIIEDSVGYLKIPAKIALGLTYIFDNKLLVTSDYTMQNFSKGSVFNSDNNLSDYSSFRFGIEYIPVPLTNFKRASYYKRIHYRLGTHYTNTYLSLAGQHLADYGFSAGIGLPWRNAKRQYTYTTFNIAYEYGIRGTTDNGLMKENYHFITIGLTFHDFWFMKPKYD